MKLENQVVSLKLARRLKELGVKQESLFAWRHNVVGTYTIVHGIIGDTTASYEWASDIFLAAFTVAELLELLPNALMGTDPEHMVHQLLLEKQATQYKAMYLCATCKGVLVGVTQDTAADALAATLANMIESKPLTPPPPTYKHYERTKPTTSPSEVH